MQAFEGTSLFQRVMRKDSIVNHPPRHPLQEEWNALRYRLVKAINNSFDCASFQRNELLTLVDQLDKMVQRHAVQPTMHAALQEVLLKNQQIIDATQAGAVPRNLWPTGHGPGVMYLRGKFRLSTFSSALHVTLTDETYTMFTPSGATEAQPVARGERLMMCSETAAVLRDVANPESNDCLVRCTVFNGLPAPKFYTYVQLLDAAGKIQILVKKVSVLDHKGLWFFKSEEAF